MTSVDLIIWKTVQMKTMTSPSPVRSSSPDLVRSESLWRVRGRCRVRSGEVACAVLQVSSSAAVMEDFRVRSGARPCPRTELSCGPGPRDLVHLCSVTSTRARGGTCVSPGAGLRSSALGEPQTLNDRRADPQLRPPSALPHKQPVSARSPRASSSSAAAARAQHAKLSTLENLREAHSDVYVSLLIFYF